MEDWDAVVLGAGQAGLSTSRHLQRRGVPHLLLDAGPAPGGAWQHRWGSLTMADVHGVAVLPDAEAPPAQGRASTVVPAWFGAYEQEHRLPVVRPVRVDRVHDEDGVLVVTAGPRTWRTRTLVSATGTWTRPFLPRWPGIEEFSGEQWHTRDYPGADHFRGLRTLVVGGGASGVQLLGELAPVTDTLWVTRRPPVWRTDDFDADAGRAAVALVEERVRQGLPPRSVVSVTGLVLRPQERAAADLGAYARLPLPARVEPHGVRWADGRRERVDAILWATGFRPAVGHLAPLRLRDPNGGIRLTGTPPTTAEADSRVQLVGYGPSASTVGATRAGRAAALAVVRWLEDASTAATAQPSSRRSSSSRVGSDSGSTT